MATSVSLSPEQRRIRASLAAHEMHARHDPREITAAARAGFLAKFIREVDAATPGLPEAERLRRAEHLMRAHMKRLALASSTSTFRPDGGCDQRDVTDPAIIRATLRVQEREGHWWVECSMCACCWQVPYYAAESVMW